MKNYEIIVVNSFNNSNISEEDFIKQFNERLATLYIMLEELTIRG